MIDCIFFGLIIFINTVAFMKAVYIFNYTKSIKKSAVIMLDSSLKTISAMTLYLIFINIDVFGINIKIDPIDRLFFIIAFYIIFVSMIWKKI